jgi:hypothetical protein
LKLFQIAQPDDTPLDPSLPKKKRRGHDDEERDKEMQWLNAERASLGLPAIDSTWLSSLVKFDYGRNREGRWRAHHVVGHLEEFIDVLERVAPAFQHLFVFDNSSGHGTHAADALVASKMPKEWGGGGSPRCDLGITTARITSSE